MNPFDSMLDLKLRKPVCIDLQVEDKSLEGWAWIPIMEFSSREDKGRSLLLPFELMLFSLFICLALFALCFALISSLLLSCCASPLIGFEWLTSSSSLSLVGGFVSWSFYKYKPSHMKYGRIIIHGVQFRHAL